MITSLDWLRGLCAEVRVKQIILYNTWVKFQAIIFNGINKKMYLKKKSLTKRGDFKRNT